MPPEALGAVAVLLLLIVGALAVASRVFLADDQGSSVEGKRAGQGAAEVPKSGAPTPEETRPEGVLLPEALRGALWEPRARAQSSWLFPVSLLGFVLLQASPGQAGVLVAVAILLFHELGHFAAMKLFGYMDVQIFFLPLIGAATSGQREGATAWQQALVALMGPAPGLALGAILVNREGIAGEIGRQMLFLNAFNLLPLEPLDGGHLLRLTLFSRWNWLEKFFATASVLALATFFWAEQRWWMLGASFLLLLSLSSRFRTIKVASALRKRWPGWPSRLPEASDSMLRDALSLLREESPRDFSSGSEVPRVVESLRAVHERILHEAPDATATVVLLLFYASLGGVALVGLLRYHTYLISL